MKLVNSTSGINNIEQTKPLSEWAAEFIRSENISRENFAEQDSYCSLRRSEKDAVRYQLRKSLRNKSSMPAKSSKATSSSKKQLGSSENHRNITKRFWKIALGVWISAFHLHDIVGIYVAKGLSPLTSWQAAILVELCVLVASSSAPGKFRRIAYGLFVYNALVFALAEVGHIVDVLNKDRINNVSVIENEIRLSELKKRFTANAMESVKNAQRLEVFLSKGYLSSGSAAFEKINRSVGATESALSSEIARIELELKASSKDQKNIYLIAAIAFLYFFLRCILQIFAIWLLKPNL